MTVHVPILAVPIVDALIEGAKRIGSGSLLDCTFGGGGHTGLLLERLERDGIADRISVTAIDQDPAAIAAGEQRFASAIAAGRLILRRSRISEVSEICSGRQWIGVLADLGFSSDQIESPEKGMSFLQPGPLDMRMDPSRTESARELLARLRETEIADVLFELGEERYSRKIASAIVRARSSGRLPSTTTELADLIRGAYPGPQRHGRIHPATRSFQALRIAVNDELGELDRLLDDVMMKVSPGGRIAVLSFHSLEDRKVKRAFAAKDTGFVALTKKPVEADEEENARNPRARSAKLRIAERLPNAEDGG